jgi:hypothetical protein
MQNRAFLGEREFIGQPRWFWVGFVLLLLTKPRSQNRDRLVFNLYDHLIREQFSKQQLAQRPPHVS